MENEIISRELFNETNEFLKSITPSQLAGVLLCLQNTIGEQPLKINGEDVKSEVVIDTIGSLFTASWIYLEYTRQNS